MRTRLLALGAAACLAVLVALPGVAATASQPVQHNGTSVTVTGPKMCMCTVNGNSVTSTSSFKNPSTVTVSQTADLTHQTVQVRWTGFTPSDYEGNGPIYSSSTTVYPVMVTECEGYRPASLNDCYDTGNSGQDNPPPAYYQNDPAFAITAPNGTGVADVQVVTALQVQSGIYCDATHLCSLVVVPSQGGMDNRHCGDHSQDADAFAGNTPNSVGEYDFTINPPSSGDPINWLCSWNKKIVIPLHFAPALYNCPHRTPDFSAEGSPMLAIAMTQWQTGLCGGASPLTIAYNGTNNEDEARNDFQQGITDVAFTTLPLTGLTGPAQHPFTYAPVAVSAVSAAFWVDNFHTGQPYTTIKLTPLLLTKQITTSYNYGGYGCQGPPKKTNPSPKATCDSAVDNNPQSIFDDRGFLKDNPGPWNPNTSNPPFDTPDVIAGTSDMTWVMTSWIAADKASTAFLDGSAQSGVHVNMDYLGIKYPVNQITPADPFANMTTQFQPQFPLYNVVEDLVNGQPPGNDPSQQIPPNPPPPWQVQAPGQRELWAVVDQADAALNLFPVAYLQNTAGKFVQPTVPAMTAAVKDMTVNPEGITLSMNFARKDPAAYPLTMVVYAVVPTGGIPKAKAAAIARFLDYVANRGQQQGSDPGDLPAGYAPLPQSLRQQTLKAASEVLNQTGNAKKSPSPSTSPTTSPATSPATSPPTSPSASTSPSKSASPLPSPTASASSTPTAHSIAISFSSPDAAGMSWVVTALIITGAVLLVSGPAALIASSPQARAAIGSGARRIRRRDRTRSYRRGVPRPTWRRKS